MLLPSQRIYRRKQFVHKPLALITGGSRGIGAATAASLASLGFSVCINYRKDEMQANKVVDAIKQQGGEAYAIAADLAQEAEILRLFAEIDRHLGPLKVLVNNAGINGGSSLVEDLNADCLHSVFATNVFASFFASREAIKRMKHTGGGSIVNVSSEAAKFGGTRIAHYAASKAALNTFTIALAREVAKDHIRVNAVSPGVIDTEIHAPSPPERIQQLLSSIPMGRMGATTEVAALISWLISDQAAYVSGAIIPITGAR
jgi:NAD(P)-dependent dehydrogenase (short-subunit alcohol dehydrogenase family)